MKLEDYYAKMMVAWFFATALAKQWDAAVVYLQQNRLEPWTHNKAIQKSTGKLPHHGGTERISEDVETITKRR